MKANLETVRIFLLAVLTASADASVTSDRFLSSCEKFFYRDTVPSGFPAAKNLKFVCQRYQGSFHFATLYDTTNRIPLYSAYKVTNLTCEGPQPSRRDAWFIEPELAGRDQTAEMSADYKVNRDWVMPVQAINEDYSDTGFDRGHLNPNFMHCGNDRVATFSLTNSVPEDPCFNRIVWYDIEVETKERFGEKCAFKNANRYVVTGAVPSKLEFIPQKDLVVHDQPEKVTERVNVPAYIWTLSCCDASQSKGGGSPYFHGVIGENKAGGIVEEFSDVDVMGLRLSVLYGYGTNVRLLADGCATMSSAGEIVIG